MDRAVLPDYDKPTSTMLMDYVKFFVRRDGNLDSIVSSRREICAALPTWTPEIHAHHQAFDVWTAHSVQDSFCASKGKIMHVDFNDETGCMITRGIVIGELERVIGPWRDAEKTAGGFNNIVDVMKSLGQQEIFEQLVEFAKTVHGAEYDTFWRTLVLDRVPDLLGGNPISPAPREMGIASRVTLGLDDLPLDFFPELPDATRFDQLTSLFRFAMISSITNHTFFTTALGEMGVGPYLANPGDLVVVMFGSKMCRVLRPDGDRYQMIGDAFVFGAMDGELIQDGSRDEQVFTIC
jgi:hypothetical protein